MKKRLSKITTASFIIASLFVANLAQAHQVLFYHSTIQQPVLHLLFHSLILVLLGVVVYSISRWWLKRKTKHVLSNTKSK